MVADLHILSPVGSVSVPAQVMFPLLIFATLQGFSSVPQILEFPESTPLKMLFAPGTAIVVTLDGGSVLKSILVTRAGLIHVLHTCVLSCVCRELGNVRARVMVRTYPSCSLLLLTHNSRKFRSLHPLVCTLQRWRDSGCSLAAVDWYSNRP